MQIERNGDSTDTTNHDEQAQDTGAFETNDHPLEEGQDQIVIALDLRRQDPSNPDGSPAPDLAFVLSGGDMSKGQDLSFHLDGIAEIFGMDPALSRIGFTKVVDFEPGTGSATLDEFRQIVNPPVDNSDQGSPTEVVEVATEQPIEDVPHDQGPEDESLSEPAEGLEGGVLRDAALDLADGDPVQPGALRELRLADVASAFVREREACAGDLQSIDLQHVGLHSPKATP